MVHHNEWTKCNCVNVIFLKCIQSFKRMCKNLVKMLWASYIGFQSTERFRFCTFLMLFNNLIIKWNISRDGVRAFFSLRKLLVYNFHVWVCFNYNLELKNMYLSIGDTLFISDKEYYNDFVLYLIHESLYRKFSLSLMLKLNKDSFIQYFTLLARSTKK